MKAVNAMLDQVIAWGGALKIMRENKHTSRSQLQDKGEDEEEVHVTDTNKAVPTRHRILARQPRRLR